MASVSNPDGVSCEEYSQFALHAVKYLSYFRDYPKPSLQDLMDLDKMVEFEPTEQGSKFAHSLIAVFAIDHCWHIA